MPHQFGIPSEVIAGVEKGDLPFSSYSPYLAPLHDKNVIGTNIAFMLGDWVSVLYFCDARFFFTFRNEILQFRNLKVTCVGHITNEVQHLTTNIKRLKRDYKSGLSSSPDTINWNWNSGGAAINFAVSAGAKRILLLGYDMKEVDGATHWHGKYPSKTHRAGFRMFMKHYPVIAEDAKKRKVEILNVSPDSALDVFPKVSLKDVL